MMHADIKNAARNGIAACVDGLEPVSNRAFRSVAYLDAAVSIMSLAISSRDNLQQSPFRAYAQKRAEAAAEINHRAPRVIYNTQ